jgi:hypothetical protein
LKFEEKIKFSVHFFYLLGIDTDPDRPVPDRHGLDKDPDPTK